MNITFPSTPNSITAAFGKPIGPTIQKLANVPAVGSALGDVHEVYYIPARDLVRSASLERAKRVAWRVTLVAVNQPISAEIDVSVNPDNTDVTSYNQGPFAAAPDNQLALLKRSNTTGTFELRLLRIPEVFLMASWLYSKSGELIVPIAPAPAGLIAGQEYTLRDLAAALLPAVQRLSNQNSDLDGQ